MTEKSDLEKLRILLPHWVEHSHSHQQEFVKWLDIARQQGQEEAAAEIERALGFMSQTDDALNRALDLLGGKVEGHHHHHH